MANYLDKLKRSNQRGEYISRERIKIELDGKNHRRNVIYGLPAPFLEELETKVREDLLGDMPESISSSEVNDFARKNISPLVGRLMDLSPGAIIEIEERQAKSEQPVTFILAMTSKPKPKPKDIGINITTQLVIEKGYAHDNGIDEGSPFNHQDLGGYIRTS
jgi:hypothetical protein